MRSFQTTLFFLLALALSGPALAASPCDCRDGVLSAEVNLMVSEREMGEGREEVLEKSERRALLKLAFSLASCEPLPAAFIKEKDGTLRIRGTTCMAKVRGPNPWPELVALACEEDPPPPLPAGFEVERGQPWSVSGEELNKIYSKTLRLVREDFPCQEEQEEESPEESQ